MQYLAAIRSLERQFKGFTLQHVDRAKNEEADALAKAAARSSAHQPSEAPKGSK
jgi:ribonuclease HI